MAGITLRSLRRLPGHEPSDHVLDELERTVRRGSLPFVLPARRLGARPEGIRVADRLPEVADGVLEDLLRPLRLLLVPLRPRGLRGGPEGVAVADGLPDLVGGVLEGLAEPRALRGRFVALVPLQVLDGVLPEEVLHLGDESRDGVRGLVGRFVAEDGALRGDAREVPGDLLEA